MKVNDSGIGHREKFQDYKNLALDQVLSFKHLSKIFALCITNSICIKSNRISSSIYITTVILTISISYATNGSLVEKA